MRCPVRVGVFAETFFQLLNVKGQYNTFLTLWNPFDFPQTVVDVLCAGRGRQSEVGRETEVCVCVGGGERGGGLFQCWISV